MRLENFDNFLLARIASEEVDSCTRSRYTIKTDPRKPTYLQDLNGGPRHRTGQESS